MDRLRGRVVFQGPSVVAEGYSATAVRTTVEIDGRRIGIDGKASAYGGTATAKGFITVPAATGQPTVFELTGAASHINLASLPRRLNVPRLATNLNARTYHVKGSVARTTTVEGSATLGDSTIADGTIVSGTTAAFATTSTPRGLESLTYTARGEVRDANLEKIGEAFQIDALATPKDDSRINATFDVKGGGTAADRLQIDATGTAADSKIYGGTLPRMAFEAHLANGALNGRADGEFRDFDPARLLDDQRYQGRVTGTVNASFGIANTAAPMTPDAIAADGRVTLAGSEIAGVAIESADIQGQYANRRGTLRQATIHGPDVDVQASGPIALDESGRSNVTYHVTATDVAGVGRLLGQPDVSGSAVLDGTVTGNATSLTIAGKLNGANAGYKANKALDLNTDYTVTVPEPGVRPREGGSADDRVVRPGGRHSADHGDGEHDVREQGPRIPGAPAETPSTVAGARTPRELDVSGSAVFHPDYSDIHIPSLSLRTQGVEWKTAPNGNAAIEYGRDRVEVRDVILAERGPDHRRLGHVFAGRHAAAGRRDREGAQRRSRAARETDDAESRVLGQY